MKKILIFTLLLINNDCIAASIVKSCNEIRAAFHQNDFGIRLKVADVDICNQKINKTLSENFIDLDYQNEISNAPDDKTVPQGLIYQTILSLSELQKKAQINCKMIKCMGISTGLVSQDINNNKVLYQYIDKEHNIKMKNISISEEGKYRFLGVFANNHLPGKKLMNLFILDVEQYNFKITQSINNVISSTDIGYYPDIFHHDVLKYVKGTPEGSNISLNPLDDNQIQLSEELAIKNLKSRTDSMIALKTYYKQNEEVYAIGSTLEDIVLNIVNPNESYFTRVQVLNYITRLTGLNTTILNNRFSKIKNYVENIMTSLIFTYSIMSTFDLERINVIAKAEDVDGVLVDNELYATNTLPSQIEEPNDIPSAHTDSKEN